MTRIKIEDIPKSMKISRNEMRSLIGGTVLAFVAKEESVLDALIRRRLKVSDPSDHEEIAKALKERYG